jgi:hypothetical protein
MGGCATEKLSHLSDYSCTQTKIRDLYGRIAPLRDAQCAPFSLLFETSPNLLRFPFPSLHRTSASSSLLRATEFVTPLAPPRPILFLKRFVSSINLCMNVSASNKGHVTLLCIPRILYTNSDSGKLISAVAQAVTEECGLQVFDT